MKVSPTIATGHPEGKGSKKSFIIMHNLTRFAPLTTALAAITTVSAQPTVSNIFPNGEYQHILASSLGLRIGRWMEAPGAN